MSISTLPKTSLTKPFFCGTALATRSTYTKKEHPEWTFVKHEDLSIDPINEFRLIFELFNLGFSDKVQRKILRSTGVHNPVEQGKRNNFNRNSKENIKNWRHRLSQGEIDRIKLNTKEIYSLFYAAKDWSIS